MKKIIIGIIIIVIAGFSGWWFMANNKVEESTSKSTPIMIDDNKEDFKINLDTKVDETFTTSTVADQKRQTTLWTNIFTIS